MKHTKKRALHLLSAAFMLIGIFSVAMTASAAAPKLSAKKASCYVNGYAELTLKGIKTKDFEKVSVTSDVKNVSIADVGFWPGEKKNSYCKIRVSGYKKGKTTARITVRYGKKRKQKKTFKISIVVNKSSYPCASFKLGSKDYTAKLGKENMYVWDKKLQGKLNLSVRAKSGWKIARIYLLNKNYASKDIKNNTTIDASKYKTVCVAFQNKKTKGILETTVTWGNWDS